ncbi:MAG TPA: M48 family metallopeptidase [Gemmatimonadota bacterium]|nr:M48 family metallopeptidase [Gemmatimonadota bacterium]
MHKLSVSMQKHFERRLRTICGAIVLSGLAAYACASSGVNKGDFNLISYQEEWALGAQLERDIARQLPLVNDRVVLAYVNRIGQRIVSQTELAQAPWKFHVVADRQINAFNIPGGHVYVNTGLIAAADNVAELAGVISHETAHGVARHGTEQLSKAYGFNIIAGLALGANPPIYQQLLASVVGAGTFARFGRDAEREADQLGVVYMYNAGYDPHGMVTMFQELLSRRQRTPGAVEEFFSSHPLTEDRIQEVRQHIAQLPPRPNLILRDAEFQSVRQQVARYNR